MDKLTVDKVIENSYRTRGNRKEIPLVSGAQIDRLWSLYTIRKQVTSFGTNPLTREVIIQNYINAGYNDIRIVEIATSVRGYRNEYILARKK